MKNEPSKCQVCGAPMPANEPLALCPKCLLAQGIAGTGDDADATTIDGQTQRPDSSLATIRYFGDYELLEEIARGGMGIVYRARQVNLNRTVAVKMILSGSMASESEVRRFRTEAESAANLQHPGIVAIHEVGLHEGQHYFSMDFVAGKNLSQTLADRKFSPMETAQCLKQMADAVHYAHQRGILHRDLKPQNVLIDGTGQPRITDFGLARKLENDSSMTRTGAIMGSPAYMAPEQAAGRQDQMGPQSDVYSLGAILYEMLTGRAPFRAETVMATLREVMELPPVRPSKLNPSVSAELETVCLKCLEKSPEKRYGSARLLAEEMERFLKGEPVLARPAGLARKSWSWMQRNPWALAGAASLVMLLLVLVSFGLWQQNQHLLWKFKNPGVKLESKFFLWRWAESGGQWRGSFVIFTAIVFLFSGPAIFADFIGRKSRQFAFKPGHLVAFGILGGLELAIGLGLALLTMKGAAWDDRSEGVIGSLPRILVGTFAFWWFGANTIWYAIREHRYLEFGAAKGWQAGHFPKDMRDDPASAISIYMLRRPLVVDFYAVVVWIAAYRFNPGRQGQLAQIGAEAMITFAFCASLWFSLRSRSAHRHFALFGLVFAGAMIVGQLVSTFGGPMFARSLAPGVLFGLLVWLIHLGVGRIPVAVNQQDFKPENCVRLIWAKSHPTAAGLAALGVLGASCLYAYLFPGIGVAQVALFLAALTPTGIYDIVGTRGQAREAKLLMYCIQVFGMMIFIPENFTLELVKGLALFLGIGLVFLKLQLDWQKRNPNGAPVPAA